MKINRLVLLLGLFLFSQEYYSQDTLDNPNVKLMKYYSAWGGHIEYSYFKANSVGVGFDLLSEPLHKRIFKRQVIYTFDCTLTGLFYKNIFSVGQRVDFGINCERLSPDFKLFIEHNDKNDVRIGGKIGLSLGNFVYIHYRHAFPTTKYENQNISRNGITITIKLNWVAMADLYGV